MLDRDFAERLLGCRIYVKAQVVEECVELVIHRVKGFSVLRDRIPSVFTGSARGQSQEL